jgi:hypothetical protein
MRTPNPPSGTAARLVEVDELLERVDGLAVESERKDAVRARVGRIR